MLSQRRMVLGNPYDRLADGTGHAGASTLRGGSDASLATTEADCARELANEKIAFGIRLRRTPRVAHGSCLLDVFFDLREAPAVGILGSRVEDRSAVTERRVREPWLACGVTPRGHVQFTRDEIDDVDLSMGIGE